MKAICYIFIHPTGPRIRKIVQKLTGVWLTTPDEAVLEHFAPPEAWVENWNKQGYQLSNWHIIDHVKSKPKVDEVVT